MIELKKIFALGALLLANQMSFAGIEFQELNFNQALEKARAENKLVFVDVFAVWCGPCKYLSAEVFTDEALGDYINANFIAIKIDGEKADGPDLMLQYEISAYPTMLFVTPDQELRKQLVGAEGADVILNAAKIAVDPSSSPIAALKKRYEEGDRDREFLKEYVQILLNEDVETEPVVNAFLENYPEIQMEDEVEFIIFCLGIKELKDPLMKDFLENTARYNELHPDFTGIKVQMIFSEMLDDAALEVNTAIIDERLPILYPAYEVLMGEEAYSFDELKTLAYEALVEEE